MFYNALAGLLIVLGVLTALLAARLLFRSGWVLAWIRGTVGLILMVVAVGFALGAVDFFSYKVIIAEKNLATLDFAMIEKQKYNAKMVTEDGVVHQFELSGDQWQVDARIIKWPASLSVLGIHPGYRLERVSGRYYSWQQELDRPRSIYPIKPKHTGVDLWYWAQEFKLNRVGIDASYGSATFLPMADGAQYEVYLTHSGLIARPLNVAAEQAVGRWMQ